MENKPIEQNQIEKSTEEGFDLETCFKNQYKASEGFERDEDSYFNSYSHFAIHEEMLKDKIRTLGYRSAILKNKHLFQDKIVLDIGCGTGILSLFAADAGAKHVYGVEYANIANHVNFNNICFIHIQAKIIVEKNNYQDKVTIIKGKIEEIELPVEKVDIIISEWMGYFLLYESMFDSVLYARDKWLTKDGLLFPDRATLFFAGMEDQEYKDSKVKFWDNVYGFNMRTIKKWVLMEPLVEVLNKKQINTECVPIFDINLKTVKKEDLEFASGFELRALRKDIMHGFIAWFEVYFTYAHIATKISTSPFSQETHWRQTVFYLEDVLNINKNDKITGSIAVKKSQKNERELEIKISCNLKSLHKEQFYRLT